MLPSLAHTLAQSKAVELPADLKEAALQCIFVKTRLNIAFCQQDLMEAHSLLHDDDRLPRYLVAEYTHQQSALARLNAEYTTSSALIEVFFSQPMATFPDDRRLQAWRLHLIVSHLKVLTLQERFSEALLAMESYDMPSMQSTMERQVQLGYYLVASDIQRSLGQLKLSKDHLEVCCNYPTLLFYDSKRYQIICALVDVRCALGEIEQAEALIQKETENLRSPGSLSKARRRLLVSSLDVDIAKQSDSSLAEARHKISILSDYFSGEKRLDISDQLLHVRTLTASARIYHLLSSFGLAIEEWEKVKRLASDYSAFRERGFTFAFSQLSIGYAQIQIARKTIEEANSIFLEEKDNYWIPMIPKWLRWIRSDITSLFQREEPGRIHNAVLNGEAP